MITLQAQSISSQITPRPYLGVEKLECLPTYLEIILTELVSVAMLA